MGYIRDLDPEVRDREAVLHEKYQESDQFFTDAQAWVEVFDDDFVNAFMKSRAYADYFEAWVNDD